MFCLKLPLLSEFLWQKAAEEVSILFKRVGGKEYMSGNQTEEFFLIFVFRLFTYLNQVIMQMHSKVTLYSILLTDYPIS